MKEIRISGKTRLCGIIGDPIEHTLSPIMQNAAFTDKGLDYVYLPLRVNQGNLQKAISGLRALGFIGVNVTIPHKVAVLPLLDDIDALAIHIGAVNTIVNQGGILKGFNTDATGFFRALKANKIAITKKRIVILGAGGAGRAIAFVLAEKGAELTILNRNLKSAEEIRERIFRALNVGVKTGELNEGNLIASLKEAEVLVNTTSLGMYPNFSETPVPSVLLRKGLVVCDIVYNPLDTRLLKEARSRGASVIGGLEMLIRQGAASFELWTGVEAPLRIMRNAVEQGLKKDEK